MEKILLTPEEAAEVLSIGRTRTYELMALGALRSVTIGRSRRVPMSSIHEFVERLSKDGGASECELTPDAGDRFRTT